jgi:hypothetical protein
LRYFMLLLVLAGIAQIPLEPLNAIKVNHFCILP